MYELRRAYRVTYDIKANWKLVISNYSECLHCPIIHPGLQKLSHYMTGDNDPPTSTWLGGRMELRPEIGTMSRDGQLAARRAAGPRRRAAATRLLLRAAAQPAAQPASRLRDDAPAVAEGARPDRDLVRVALPSARVPDAGLRSRPTRSTSGTTPTVRTGACRSCRRPASPRAATAPASSRRVKDCCGSSIRSCAPASLISHRATERSSHRDTEDQRVFIATEAQSAQRVSFSATETPRSFFVGHRHWRRTERAQQRHDLGHPTGRGEAASARHRGPGTRGSDADGLSSLGLGAARGPGREAAGRSGARYPVPSAL